MQKIVREAQRCGEKAKWEIIGSFIVIITGAPVYGAECEARIYRRIARAARCAVLFIVRWRVKATTIQPLRSTDPVAGYYFSESELISDHSSRLGLGLGCLNNGLAAVTRESIYAHGR